jgi:hypothetical protein
MLNSCRFRATELAPAVGHTTGSDPAFHERRHRSAFGESFAVRAPIRIRKHKPREMPGSSYQRQYEPTFMVGKKAANTIGVARETRSDVWFMGKPVTNDLYPTMKPVELVERRLPTAANRRSCLIRLADREQLSLRRSRRRVWRGQLKRIQDMWMLPYGVVRRLQERSDP